MGTAVRVLMVHDSPETAQLLVRELTNGGYDPLFERAATRAELERKTQPGSLMPFAVSLAMGPLRVGLDERDLD